MPRSGNSNSRCAYHAGSWYTDDGDELNRQLGDWLSKARSTPNSDVGASARAIIAPHAGYLYCGACAAFAYKHIEPSTTKRVFILGWLFTYLTTSVTTLATLIFPFQTFPFPLHPPLVPLHYVSLSGCVPSLLFGFCHLTPLHLDMFSPLFSSIMSVRPVASCVWAPVIKRPFTYPNIATFF